MNALVKLTVSALFVFVSIVGLEAQTIDANGTLTFPLGTKSIQSKAYRENLDIKDIEFPTTLEGIGSYAFEYCAYIDADLVLPDGLKTVGKEAFYRCINTRRITVPASVTSIGDYAFSKNTSLVVVENSYAHQWAVDNGYDFQFSPEGMPNGVSEVFTAPFLKTSWGQRNSPKTVSS